MFIVWSIVEAAIIAVGMSQNSNFPLRGAATNGYSVVLFLLVVPPFAYTCVRIPFNVGEFSTPAEKRRFNRAVLRVWRRNFASFTLLVVVPFAFFLFANSLVDAAKNIPPEVAVRTGLLFFLGVVLFCNWRLLLSGSGPAE